MKRPIPFAGPFNERIAKAISAETCVNWYPEITRTHNNETMILKMRPGLKYNQMLNGGPVRGSLVHGSNLFVVSGSSVFSVDINDVSTVIGTLVTDTGMVGMASSGTELVIVDGTDGWVWNGATFTKITDVDFVDASQVKFHKGRFIVNAPGTGRFYISASYDATSWSSLDFATAEIDPDDLIAIEVDHQELWLFGEYTTESYYFSGNALFPFEPRPGASIEWGCVAPWSIAKGDNTVVWLAQTRNGGRQIIKATSINPQVISTDAIEESLSVMTRVDDAVAFVVKGQDRHLFYVITFPTADKTFVYDFSTGLWHGWDSFGAGKFRISTHTFFNGKSYMGDLINGNLYEFDGSTYSDNGQRMVRSRKTEHSSSNQNIIFCGNLELLFNVGHGLISGQGSDPQVALYYSDDGGNTFGNVHTRSLGAIGKYKNRVRFDRLGKYYHRVYEIRISDPVPTNLIGAYAELEMGMK